MEKLVIKCTDDETTFTIKESTCKENHLFTEISEHGVYLNIHGAKHLRRFLKQFIKGVEQSEEDISEPYDLNLKFEDDERDVLRVEESLFQNHIFIRASEGGVRLSEKQVKELRKELKKWLKSNE